MQQTDVHHQTAPLNVYVGREQPEKYVCRFTVCRQLELNGGRQIDEQCLTATPAPKCSHSININ
jgi:hypothetical protein